MLHESTRTRPAGTVAVRALALAALMTGVVMSAQAAAPPGFAAVAPMQHGSGGGGSNHNGNGRANFTNAVANSPSFLRGTQNLAITVSTQSVAQVANCQFRPRHCKIRQFIVQKNARRP